MECLIKTAKDNIRNVRLNLIEKIEVFALLFIGVLTSFSAYSTLSNDVPVVSKVLFSFVSGVLTMVMLIGVAFLLSLMVCMVVDATIRILDFNFKSDAEDDVNIDYIRNHAFNERTENTEDTTDYSERIMNANENEDK